MNGKSCFFIGHRETSEAIYPTLYAAVEQHILEYGVTEFIVGHYGVFDRLAAGEAPGEELGQPQKGCRIWQLRKGVDVTMRFIGYEDLIQRFGEPDADNYTQVFDGDLGTNDLEQIYAICRDSPPPEYQGYRMALSDVVELYDDSGSEFFYCDRVGFRPIQFNQHQEQNECHEMTM